VTRVHVLQVNTDPANVADLSAAVAAGRTDEDGGRCRRMLQSAILSSGTPRGAKPFVVICWAEEPQGSYIRPWAVPWPSRCHAMDQASRPAPGHE
jgi:hypothetical protein